MRAPGSSSPIAGRQLQAVRMTVMAARDAASAIPFLMAVAEGSDAGDDGASDARRSWHSRRPASKAAHAPADEVARWLERIRTGDHDAFEEMYFAYYAPLCEFALRYTRSEAAAEDIVSEVLARVWLTRESLVVRATLSSYLYGAVRNRALNYGRDTHVVSSAHARLASEPHERAGIAAHPIDASALLERADLLHQLRALIAQLPERRRIALELRWSHGLSYAEIADVMGTSVQTVANQLVRTLKELRSKLPHDFL